MPDIFSPANTAKALYTTLDEAYAAIPKGHTKALILDATASKTAGHGLRGAYVQRGHDGNWGVIIEGGYNGTDGAHGGFKVAWSGK